MNANVVVNDASRLVPLDPTRPVVEDVPCPDCQPDPDAAEGEGRR